MAQYFVDTSALANLDDFTSRSGTADSFSLVSNGTRQVARLVSPAAGVFAQLITYSYDPAGESTDQEVAILVAFPSVEADASDEAGGAATRITASDRWAYFQHGADATYLGQGSSNRGFWGASTGAKSVLKWFRLRTIIDGSTSTVSVKVWNDGDTEPAWLDSSSRDNHQGTGRPGIMLWGRGHTMDIHAIGVGTGGDAAPTAPLPAPGPTITDTDPAGPFTVGQSGVKLIGSGFGV